MMYCTTTSSRTTPSRVPSPTRSPSPVSTTWPSTVTTVLKWYTLPSAATADWSSAAPSTGRVVGTSVAIGAAVVVDAPGAPVVVDSPEAPDVVVVASAVVGDVDESAVDDEGSLEHPNRPTTIASS